MTNLMLDKPNSYRSVIKRQEDSEYGKIHMLDISKICEHPERARKVFNIDSLIKLADSIRRYGVLQPLTVRRAEHFPAYEIVAGHRRFRAAKLLGLSNIPCIIISTNDKRAAELALVENIVREPLNFFEKADLLSAYIQAFNLTPEDAAGQLSVSKASVYNALSLLLYSSHEREKIVAYGLTERHALAIREINQPDIRLNAIEYVKDNNLNVAKTEDYIKKLLADKSSCVRPPSQRIIFKDVRIFHNSLKRSLNLCRQAGIELQTHVADSDDDIQITIKIPKKYNVSRETFDLSPELHI